MSFGYTYYRNGRFAEKSEYVIYDSDSFIADIGGEYVEKVFFVT